MRTNIGIDDKLMNDALKATGLKTKKDAVELGINGKWYLINSWYKTKRVDKLLFFDRFSRIGVMYLKLYSILVLKQKQCTTG